MAETEGETSNTCAAFTAASSSFDKVDFDALLQTFQDWEDTLKSENINFDELSL